MSRPASVPLRERPLRKPEAISEWVMQVFTDPYDGRGRLARR